MNQSANAPTVRALTDRTHIQSILEHDRVWSAYALGDLDDGMFEQCDWFAADDSLVLIFKGLGFVPLVTVGGSAGITAILSSALTLPEVFLNQRREHLPAVEQFYQCDDQHWMWRMDLREFAPAPSTALFSRSECLIRLGMDRLDDLRVLYATDNGADAFAPYQLATGYFFGVEQDGRLVSAAGVHLASHAYRVGAVGNVFTHPAHRGRGHAAACTSAVTRALRADGMDTIILNVEQRNTTAIRVYERLGFAKYCEFVEGVAKRKA